MITLLRCDDRLIHGQCMNMIVRKHFIKDIIVVDDYTANNAIMKRIFQAAVPKGMTATAVTFEDSIALIKQAMTNDVNTLVLMRLPSIMLEIFKIIPDLPKDFNIANVVAKNATVDPVFYAHFNDVEINAVKEMDAMGVHIWFNLIPDKPTTEWKDIKSKF